MKLCACGCGKPTKIARVTRANRGHIKGQPMRTLFRHGAPKPLAERFWKKVNKNGPTVRPELGPCWVWTGGTMGVGYAVLSAEGHNTPATHVAAYLETGRWPKLEVCHRCDNKLCVRYSHTFEGTHEANMQDMAEKNRGGTSKLTSTEVITIRQKYATGSISQKNWEKNTV